PVFVTALEASNRCANASSLTGGKPQGRIPAGLTASAITGKSFLRGRGNAVSSQRETPRPLRLRNQPKMNRPSAAAADSMSVLIAAQRADEERIRLGGGPTAIERQRAKGRHTARERIARLVDSGTGLLELGLWAAHDMYDEWGGAPAA